MSRWITYLGLLFCFLLSPFPLTGNCLWLSCKGPRSSLTHWSELLLLLLLSLLGVLGGSQKITRLLCDFIIPQN